MIKIICINKCLRNGEHEKINIENTIIIFFDKIYSLWHKIRKKLKINHLENMPKSIYIFGSIENIQNIGLLHKNILMSLHPYSHEYLDDTAKHLLFFFGEDYINFEKSYFKTKYQLSGDDIGMFIKSDSGKKLLSGQMLDNTLLAMIEQNQIGLLADDLLLLAPYVHNIYKEYRFFILDDKIIASSFYSHEKNFKAEDIPEKVIIFVNNLINSNKCLPSNFVLDVALIGQPQSDQKIKVIEINNFFTSGFYHANLANIIISLPLVI